MQVKSMIVVKCQRSMFLELIVEPDNQLGSCDILYICFTINLVQSVCKATLQSGP